MNNKLSSDEIILTTCKAGDEVELTGFTCGQSCRKKMRGLGLHDGTCLYVIRNNSHQTNGPMVVRVGETRLMLGHGLAAKIKVRLCPS